MKLLLDTSVLIDVLRGDESRKALLASLVNDGHLLYTTAVNVLELYAGLRPGEDTHIPQLLDLMECYAIESNTGKSAGLLKNAWARKGKTISLPDAIVAAVAIDRGCTLLTDNRKDFPMPKLNLYPLP